MSPAKTPLFGAEGLDVRRLVTPSRRSVLLLRDLDAEMRAVMVSLIVKRILELRAISEQQERVVPIDPSRAEKYSVSDPIRAEAERQKARDCLKRAEWEFPAHG